MGRHKDWTEDDMIRALQWVENKAKTGSVFRGQSETAEELLPCLAAIADPEGLAVALRDALTEDAWRRLLSALRQRKHQAERAGDAAAETPDQKECSRCRWLSAEVSDLRRQLEISRAEIVQLEDQILEYQDQAGLCDEEAADMTSDSIPRSHLQLSDDGRALLERLLEKHGNWMTGEGEAPEGISRALGITDTLVGTAPAPLPSADEPPKPHRLDSRSEDRDHAILRMFTEGTAKRAIARALGISDGTVRNVLKRKGMTGLS